MKRRVKIILVYLVLGAVMNVGVAWAIAIAVPRLTDSKMWVSHPDGEGGFQYWWFERRIAGLRLMTSDDWTTDMVAGEFRVPPPPTDFMTLWEYRGNPLLAEPSTEAIRTSFNIELTGWPQPAFFSAMEYSSVTIEDNSVDGPSHPEEQLIRLGVREGAIRWAVWERAIRRGIFIGDESYLQASNWDEFQVLPLGVLWRGGLINTTFYAMMLWLAFPARRQLIRMIRRRRGLCIKCAYNLSGTDHTSCPECGAEVVGKASRQALPDGRG